MGYGKTAIIARLVALSCHGHHMWPSTTGKQIIPKCKYIQIYLAFDLLLSIYLKFYKNALKFGLKQTDHNEYKHPDGRVGIISTTVHMCTAGTSTTHVDIPAAHHEHNV